MLWKVGQLTGFFINSLLAWGSSTAALSMMFFIPCSSFNKGFLFFFSSSSIAAYSSNAAKYRFPSRLLNIFRCSTKMFYQRQRRCKQQGRGQQHSILKILERLLCKTRWPLMISFVEARGLNYAMWVQMQLHQDYSSSWILNKVFRQ